ncbi:MAG TPA: twitching motility protein PilT, partial [Gammaproteobacteria bacterium]|nr:twitching motility protein PilT [Gammaproteobacteria bacterium]
MRVAASALRAESEFRFYEELNDFLPEARRRRTFEWRFRGTPSVKDTIEAIGVPHTEVDLVLVDGRSVGFEVRLRGGERVAVYPVFERLDISPLVRLRPEPLRVTRFVADVHLGTLARHL